VNGWPSNWSALYSGAQCSMCAPGRPEEDEFGVRVLAGKYSDAYLQRAAVQRGYTVVIWRGRHVVEPTDLEREEACGYWLEVLEVARALRRHYQTLKMNYETLGNSLPHFHTHLVPRYLDDPAPGRPFPLVADASALPAIPEPQLRDDVAALRSILTPRS
jgi:diadenosine tetraphosphate (Ap4A) HIT family hydrolase